MQRIAEAVRHARASCVLLSGSEETGLVYFDQQIGIWSLIFLVIRLNRDQN
jgi:hypothetical protein